MATAIATIPDAHPAQTDQQAHFSLMQRKAQLFANSPLIPETLRAGGPQQALANCYIGLTIAEAMNENPLTVLQNIHVVKGKAGFSAQFMIARANASGVFKGRIGWREQGQGETLSVTAYAMLADTGEEVSFTADMAMAKAEGWTSNPKYKSMGPLMLRYRSATFLVRLYAPDVMFGYQTAEEVDDVVAAAPIAVQPITPQALLAQASDDDQDEGGMPVDQRGEAQTTADAEADIMAHLARKTTVIDVNSLASARMGELDEDGQQRLRDAAQERIAQIKGAPTHG